MHRSTRLAATNESEVVLGVELANSLVAREGDVFIRQRLRYLVLDIQGRVDAAVALRESDKAFVGTLGI